MNISIICVGKIKENFYTEAIAEYSKRLSRFCKLNIIEVPDEKIPENASLKEEELVKEKEGKKIIAKIPASAFVYTLEIGGKAYSSDEFASEIASQGLSGNSHLVFIIGGSLGLSSEVRKLSDSKLSFSKFTFPHQLMRVILLEQIYRGFKINANEPYHK
ncbi:MAG: 23S rRNA (pseudouridine(1915)-N(3))-methyltransferase RlmH [Lachnospiraceae bacterium]|nr:23S rRNA (pseudouridine(1915)-N(3))-methyltransferase RlmH [Lachnospiraceae bacterium]